MIRSVKIAVFPGIQKRFLLRKAADSVVEVHTIRFVRLPFGFASHEGWRDAVSAITNDKVQMPNLKKKCDLEERDCHGPTSRASQ
jgi:hypothetical protein